MSLEERVKKILAEVAEMSETLKAFGERREGTILLADPRHPWNQTLGEYGTGF